MMPLKETIEELMNRKEDLHPALEPYIEDIGPFKAIRHPLVYEVPYHTEMNAVINVRYKFITEHVAKLKAKRDFVGYVWRHERPHRITAFLEVANDDMTNQMYWSTLGTLWIDSENIWQNRRAWLDLFRCDRSGRRVYIMSPEEDLSLSNMPEVLTIWRGGVNGKWGMSWTLMRDKAIFFRDRFKGSQRFPHKLYRAEVKREHVLAYFQGRGEHEIVVDPKTLSNITTEE